MKNGIKKPTTKRMYLFRSLVIQFIVLLIIQFNQPGVDCLDDKNEGGFFSSIGRFFSAPFKKEEPKKNFWGQAAKPDKKESGWFSFGGDRKRTLKKLNEEEPKPDEAKAGWFPNLKLLNLVSQRDLNEIPLNEPPKDASKSQNLSNWEYMPNFNLSNYNFNFSNYNFSNWELPKFNYTTKLNYTVNLLSLNSSKEWFSSWSFASIKAKYYGNLLNNRTSNDTLSSTTNDTNDTASSTSNDTNDTSNSTMNYTMFRERLIKVYDNFTSCAHPCNGILFFSFLFFRSN